jgi:hypothetical protein
VALADSRFFIRAWQQVEGWECRGLVRLTEALAPARVWVLRGQRANRICGKKVQEQEENKSATRGEGEGRSRATPMQSAFTTPSCGLRRRCSGEGRQATGFRVTLASRRNERDAQDRSSALTWIVHTRLEMPAVRSAGFRPGVGEMAGRRRVGDRRSGGCEMFGQTMWRARVGQFSAASVQ